MGSIAPSLPDRADDRLFCQLESVSVAPVWTIAAAVAAVLDAAGSLAPMRGAPSGPMRKLGPAGMAGLVEAATHGGDPDDVWIKFERPEVDLWGDVLIYSDTRLDTDPRTHTVQFNLPLRTLTQDPGTADAVAKLAGDLFVAVQGFYGKLDAAAVRNRMIALHGRAADEGRRWIPPWDDLTYSIWDRWVEDVWWVNLFGPAYVQRWRRKTFDQLGIRRVDLDNGGLMVWSGDLPADPDEAESVTGFGHKQSFYRVLGMETFIHESLDVPGPGERVPTLYDHREAAQSGGRG
jgi:hypothetical protein